MKTIKWSDSAEAGEIQQAVAEVLTGGGLVCLPCGGKYRLFADLGNVDAVMHLMQSKSRVRRAPALVFIDREDRLGDVAEEVDPVALRLARALWPQPLTIRVKPNPELPSKVLKQLGGSKSRIGVRVPADPFIRALLTEVGRPLLVSSANKEAKAGDGSPAQVRTSFSAHVDLFVDRGDLAPEPRSTVVEVHEGTVAVERVGAVGAEAIEQAARGS
jgi:L-threonylcarbamoyladenylate synthase